MLENNQKELVLLEDLGMIFPKETSKTKYRYGLYKCFCGNEFKSRTQDVKNSHTNSCGCYKKEKATSHNLSKHRLYKTWQGLIDRCNNINNKDYINYGGRGITVCDEWFSVENFINDMFPSYIEGLTIDRKDNSKGYYKDNCRWATKIIQSRNQRKLMINNTSGYRGVSFCKKTNKYDIRICVNNKSIHLGSFVNKLDGALTYDNYIISNNLEHTRNFN